MKLYTKTGDDGTTSLFGGQRVDKTDPRVAAYGDVDELNAVIGVAVATCADVELADRLRLVQSDLFTLGGALASPGDEGDASRITDERVRRLESWIDHATAEVSPLRNFVLPGGSATAAHLHVARTVCRRAERAAVALSKVQSVRAEEIVYLNRLSDLLFAWARWSNQRGGVADVIWRGGRGASADSTATRDASAS